MWKCTWRGGFDSATLGSAMRHWDRSGHLEAPSEVGRVGRGDNSLPDIMKRGFILELFKCLRLLWNLSQSLSEPARLESASLPPPRKLFPFELQRTLLVGGWLRENTEILVRGVTWVGATEARLIIKPKIWSVHPGYPKKVDKTMKENKTRNQGEIKSQTYRNTHTCARMHSSHHPVNTWAVGCCNHSD